MSSTMYFTRLFTKGTLKGIRHLDKITFPTAERCVRWYNAIIKNHQMGRINYTIVDRSFQSYAR